MINLCHTFVAFALLIQAKVYADEGTNLFPHTINSLIGNHSNSTLSVLETSDLSGTETNFNQSVSAPTFKPSSFSSFSPTSKPSRIPSSTPTAVYSAVPTLISSSTPSSQPSFTSATKILPPDGSSFEHFGRSVAISDDFMIIGTWGDDDNGEDSGSAYLFSSSGSFLHKLLAPDGEADDWFGRSVAISSIGVVIGAHGDDDNGTNSGAAYLYTFSGQTKLLAPDGASDDIFGRSVTMSNNFIIVGAHLDDDNGSDSGSAYIFSISGEYISKLLAPDGQSNAHFGYSLAVTENMIVVGARGENNSKGAAYLFKTDGSFQNKLEAFDGSNSDYFGGDVAAYGERIVVGAEGDDDNGTNTGSAYIFTSNGILVEKIKAPEGSSFDNFGYSVDVSENIVAIGARSNDNENGSNAGAVYLFTTEGAFIEKVVAPDGQAGDKFGQDVSVAGNNLLVGAYFDDDNGSASGSAYLYLLDNINT